MLDLNKISENKKIYVGLSGGVDSSVSALLLKQQGYDVTGVFIKGWHPDWIPCTWKTDRISAMRTAAHLDIPFITLDLEKEYKDKVVSYILDEYSKGRTPNPDMLCNREIKFGHFLRWALRQGADMVATGHYAQVIDGKLVESEDKEKDQSYFLSQLTSENLSKIIFPIGHLVKTEVRKIATEYGLPVASRKDSQGICFVGDLSMKQFLKKELQPIPGKVLNKDGEIIGEHEGAILYTLGERHGFIIYNQKTEQETMYVVDKDIIKNTITVSSKVDPLDNVSKNVFLQNFSYALNPVYLKKVNELTLRTRYRGQKYPVKIVQVNDQGILLEVEEKVEVTPGQFGVLYDRGICLGGGEIK